MMRTQQACRGGCVKHSSHLLWWDPAHASRSCQHRINVSPVRSVHTSMTVRTQQNKSSQNVTCDISKKVLFRFMKTFLWNNVWTLKATVLMRGHELSGVCVEATLSSDGWQFWFNTFQFFPADPRRCDDIPHFNFPPAGWTFYFSLFLLGWAPWLFHWFCSGLNTQIFKTLSAEWEAGRC